jgi:hypothetical protein
MANDMISIKIQGMDEVQKVLAAFPKAARAAAYRLVNDQAVSFKRHGPEVIAAHETVRNPAFVKSAFIFEKAKHADSIDDIQASAGSIGPVGEKFENFTGWIEQIDPSLAPKRTRAIGPSARGGSMAGNVKKAYRLDPGKNIPNARDFTNFKPGKKNARNVQFMAMLHRQKYRGTFILEKEDAPAGLYTFSNEMTAGWVCPAPIRLQ